MYGYDLYDALQTGDVVCICMPLQDHRQRWISAGTSLVQDCENEMFKGAH